MSKEIAIGRDARGIFFKYPKPLPFLDLEACRRAGIDVGELK